MENLSAIRNPYRLNQLFQKSTQKSQIFCFFVKNFLRIIKSHPLKIFLIPLTFFVISACANDGSSSGGGSSSDNEEENKDDVPLTKKWSKLLGTSNNDWGDDVGVDSAGNVYVTGTSEGDFDKHVNSGYGDMFLIKYSSSGVKQWSQLLGSGGYDEGEGISVDSAGNVYVAGYFGGDFDGYTNSGEHDVFLVKYDSSGNKQWSQLLGTDSSDVGYGVSVGSAGNVHVTGQYGGNMFLVKYDSSGNQQWSQLLGTSSDDWGKDVSVDSTGNVYVTGSSYGNFDGHTNSGERDMFLVKYSSSGVKQWSQLLGSGGYDGGEGISVDSAGNIYVTGLFGYSKSGGGDMFLLKYDSSGIKQWFKRLGTSNNDWGNDVSVDSAGNIYVTGGSWADFDGHINSGERDMFLVKYDGSGNKKWSKLFGSINKDDGYAVSVDSAGSVYVTGSSYGNFDGHANSGENDMFLIRFGK